MIKRLILLFLLFLSFSLMGTTAKAMDCEWVSNFKNNPGLETDVSNKNYLKTPIPREEYKRLLESFSSYSDCVDKEIKMILTKMSSLETSGNNRKQLILTLDEKLREIKNKRKFKNIENFKDIILKEAKPTIVEDMHEIAAIKDYIVEK